MAKIRFYTDEHISKAVIQGLRLRGIDVLSISETRLFGATDEHHLGRATSEGRVVLTQDADFLALAAGGKNHQGIVFAPQGTPIGRLIQGLLLIYEVLEAEEMVNHIEFL